MADDHTVLGRTLEIVSACSSGTTPMTLARLARSTGIPKPTVRRIAENLVRREVLDRTPSGYVGGVALIEFGERASRQRAARANVTPHLTELHARPGVAATWLVDPTGGSSWSLVGSVFGHDAVRSGYSDSWPRDPRVPGVLASALGRLVLSHRPDLVEILLRTGVPPMTRHSRVAPGQLWSTLRDAHTYGFSMEHEELYLGWSCLAVAVAGDSGSLDAVIGVVGRTAQFRESALLAIARATADDIAADWRS